MSSTKQMALLPVLISLVCATLASGAAGVRIELTRIHSAGPGVTASQFVCDALRRDMHRHKARELAASGRTVSAPTRKDSPDGASYLMILGIGTPPLPYPAIADTGSDRIWTQCAPCGSQCFKQPAPLYNPARSPTFRVLPCGSSLGVCAGAAPSPPPGSACPYTVIYGTGWTSGYMGCETFTFGSAPAHQARVAGIAFGCSNASSRTDWIGSAGLVGLGRGNLSLVSQLGAGRFSYCLTPFQDANSTSTLLLGPSASAALNSAGGVRSTPFVASPNKEPMSSYYYLNLTGISLGTKVLSIPPDALSLKADGTGGFLIDSGTTFTILVDAAYQQIRAAVLSLVTLPTTKVSGGLDLCFALPSPTSAPPAMPSMTLHFDRADMVLPADNYMMLVSDSSSWCLTMQNQTNGGVSLLGNYQQQNMHILYDVGQETLSFAPAKCSTL